MLGTAVDGVGVAEGRVGGCVDLVGAVPLDPGALL